MILHCSFFVFLSSLNSSFSTKAYESNLKLHPWSRGRHYRDGRSEKWHERAVNKYDSATLRIVIALYLAHLRLANDFRFILKLIIRST